LAKIIKAKDSSTGIILYREFPRGIKYLLLKHRQGHWALCKGHGNAGETKIQTALRELREETGIRSVTLLSKRVMVKEQYMINKKQTEKTVEYFIGKTKTENVKIDGKEIRSYMWRGYKSALNRITYNKSKKTLTEADEIIRRLTEKE